MPKFLLLGAGGLVGRQLRSTLSGHEVTCTYHRAAGNDIGLDITDHERTTRLILETRPDVVLLAAADAFVERCEREPTVTRRVNVEAPRAISEASAGIGALLVVFSSEYVFDGTAGAYAEGDERRPLNEYGRQKVALEDLALATGRGLVCRTSGVFGDDPNRKNFVCQLVDRLRGSSEFVVPSDQLVTPTFAPSLAEAAVALAIAGRTGVFHVAGPRILNRLEFARMTAAAFGLPADLVVGRPTSELGGATKRPHAAGLDVRKLRSALGHDLVAPDEALREMAAVDGRG